jgi:uncharacterized protein (DUF2235 family)
MAFHSALLTLSARSTIIRDAYLFIAQNYVEGDEIMLFGFSRGAYIARKVAGLLVGFRLPRYDSLLPV